MNTKLTHPHFQVGGPDADNTNINAIDLGALRPTDRVLGVQRFSSYFDSSYIDEQGNVAHDTLKSLEILVPVPAGCKHVEVSGQLVQIVISNQGDYDRLRFPLFNLGVRQDPTQGVTPLFVTAGWSHGEAGVPWSGTMQGVLTFYA